MLRTYMLQFPSTNDLLLLEDISAVLPFPHLDQQPCELEHQPSSKREVDNPNFFYTLVDKVEEDYRESRTQWKAFSDFQLGLLESTFEQHKYLTVEERGNLARALGLSVTQVKTWFQRKRRGETGK